MEKDNHLPIEWGAQWHCVWHQVQGCARKLVVREQGGACSKDAQ